MENKPNNKQTTINELLNLMVNTKNLIIDENLLSSDNIGLCLIAKTKMDNLKRRKHEGKEQTIYSEKNQSWENRFNKTNDMKEEILKTDEILFEEQCDKMKKMNDNFYETDEKEITIKISSRNTDMSSTFVRNRIFKEFPNINQKVLSNLERCGYIYSTMMQSAIIPLITCGKDVMGFSHTGTGKTLSFLLPIINKMIIEGPPNLETYNCKYYAPVYLILQSTHELVEQVYKEARRLSHRTGINIVKLYGGVAFEPQLKEMDNGCDILVSTPGRLIDFIESGFVTLSALKYLIIDEADAIISMGGYPQILKILNNSDCPSKENRQNMLFSATFSNRAKKLSHLFLKEEFFLVSSYKSVTNSNVKHMLIYTTEDQKCQKLHAILQCLQENIIIFISSKKGANNLARFLNNANYNAIAIHGSKKQLTRHDAIEKFKNGQAPILIATELASRGIDFPNVGYIINFDMPLHIEDYIHRSGRTGRCGNNGTCVSFLTDNNSMIYKDLYDLLVGLNQEVPSWFEKIVLEMKSIVQNSMAYEKIGTGLKSNFKNEQVTGFKRERECNNTSKINRKELAERNPNIN